ITINQREYVAPRNEIETNLVQIFEEVLNTENVSINDNFFEIGGDSLKAIKVTSILSKKWNITIKDIFEFKTIMLISKVISNREEENMLTKLEKLKSSHPDTYDNSNSAIPINYKKETLKNYSSISSNNIKDISSVLLTGVTGYLGIHLLNNLLKSTYSKIYLLIRNKSFNLNKISELWAYYFEENIPIYFLKRLKIIYGNIENEHLNLNSKMYEDLSKNIDIIINSAANVSHFSDREDSYKTNVYSLHNLLEFANHNKKKEFHHMSTISIASGNVNNDISKLNHFTENDLNISQNPNNVYVESKISAEEILRSNEYSNLNINIYRLGNLQCDSKTGIFQKNPENNAFFRIIKSFKNFGIYPLINNDYLEFTEVDKVSEACVKLICNSQLNNETYHLFNNNLLKLSDLMSIYISLDFNIKSVSWNDFIDLLIQKFKNSSIDDDLDRFLLHTGILDGNIFNSSDFEIHSFKTNFILNKLGFNWEYIDKDTLKSMINHSKNSF
ncbi:SDR family oxidoreductase, partial [Staphylococcus warneri]